jgi:hypothetical protein
MVWRCACHTVMLKETCTVEVPTGAGALMTWRSIPPRRCEVAI